MLLRGWVAASTLALTEEVLARTLRDVRGERPNHDANNRRGANIFGGFLLMRLAYLIVLGIVGVVAPSLKPWVGLLIFAGLVYLAVDWLRNSYRERRIRHALEAEDAAQPRPQIPSP